MLALESESLSACDDMYTCVVSMASKHFVDVCREASNIGETVTIEADKESMRFAVHGDIGRGDISIRQKVDEDPFKCVKVELSECFEPTSFALKYLLLFNKCAAFAP